MDETRADIENKTAWNRASVNDVESLDLLEFLNFEQVSMMNFVFVSLFSDKYSFSLFSCLQP